MRLILLCAILLFSCAHPKDLVYKGAGNVGVEHLGLKNTVVSVDLYIYNPNNFRLKLKSSDVDVFINDKPAGKALVTQKCAIPKLDTFTVPVLLRVDLVDVIPNAWQLLTAKDIKLRLNGVVKAGKHGVYVNIPVSYEGLQKLRK